MSYLLGLWLAVGFVVASWYLSRLPGWPRRGDERIECVCFVIVLLTWPVWLLVGWFNRRS